MTAAAKRVERVRLVCTRCGFDWHPHRYPEALFAEIDRTGNLPALWSGHCTNCAAEDGREEEFENGVPTSWFVDRSEYENDVTLS